jgi:hypothetical protein
MQPSKAIAGIIEAARQHVYSLGGESQDTATIRHLKETLETAIETLCACEAVQAELERQLGQVEDDNDQMAQNLLDDAAQMAVLRRQLSVALQPKVEVNATWTWIEGKPKRSHKKK